MESIVIVQFLISSISRRVGIAVISFDLASVAVWAKTIPLSEDHALTICRQSRCSVFLKDLLDVLPSMAMTPFKRSDNDLAQFAKHSENCFGSKADITLFIVSWEGIPFGKSRNDSKKSCLHFAKSSMSLKPSAPQMTPHSTIVRMSVRLCLMWFSARLSVRIAKCCMIRFGLWLLVISFFVQSF